MLNKIPYKVKKQVLIKNGYDIIPTTIRWTESVGPGNQTESASRIIDNVYKDDNPIEYIKLTICPNAVMMPDVVDYIFEKIAIDKFVNLLEK